MIFNVDCCVSVVNIHVIIGAGARMLHQVFYGCLEGTNGPEDKLVFVVIYEL